MLSKVVPASYVFCYKSPLSLPGHPEISWGLLAPPGASWSLLEPPGASWRLLRPPGPPEPPPLGSEPNDFLRCGELQRSTPKNMHFASFLMCFFFGGGYGILQHACVDEEKAPKHHQEPIAYGIGDERLAVQVQQAEQYELHGRAIDEEQMMHA